MKIRAKRALIGALVTGSFMAGACKDGGTTPFVPVATGLAVSAPDKQVFVESSIQLSGAVRDQEGSPMTTEPILWISRDPTTAAVDSTGTVRGVAAGEVWIVATSGLLADSVRIDVRYHVFADEVRVRVRGAVEVIQGWKGAGFFFDWLGTDDGDLSLLGAASADGGTFMVVTIPGSLAKGETVLPEWDPYLLKDQAIVELEASLGYLAVMETNLRMRLYRSTGQSRLQVDSVTAAFGSQSSESMVWGRVVMEADGYIMELDDQYDVQVTRTTERILLHADFAIRVEHWPVGNASFEIVEGTGTVSGERREAWWDESWYDDKRGRIDVEDGPPYITVHTDLAEGTFPIDSLNAHYAAYSWGVIPGPGTFVTASLENGFATSTDGSLTLGPLSPSASGAFDELVGDASVEMMIQGTDRTATITLRFHVPVAKEGAQAHAVSRRITEHDTASLKERLWWGSRPRRTAN